MKPATRTASVLLGLVALAQLARVVFQVEVTIGGKTMPMWASVVAFLVAGALSMALWREARAAR